MNKIEFVKIFKSATLRGSKSMLSHNKLTSTIITKATAYRIYGRSNIDRWIKEGLLKPTFKSETKSGTYLFQKDVDRVASSSNRISYLMVDDR